jgi:hypothetical protein
MCTTFLHTFLGYLNTYRQINDNSHEIHKNNTFIPKWLKNVSTELVRMMWFREGNIANAMCWGINPLSLEHEGRSSIFYCARSFGIIGGIWGGGNSYGKKWGMGDTVCKRDATEQTI